jgi:MFS family permease
VRTRIWIMTVYGAVTMLVTGMIGPILPLYLSHLKFPVADIGIIVAIGGFTSAVLSLFFGNLTDRFNRTRLFIISALVMTALPIGYALAANGTQFIILELMQGLIGPMAAVTSQAILLDLARASGERGKVMGNARGIRSAAFVVGPLLGGVVAAWLSLRGVFVVESAILLAIACAATAVLRRQEPPAAQNAAIFALPELLRDRVVLSLLGIMLLDFMNFQAMLLIFPLYAKSVGLHVAVIGILVTTQSLAYAAVQRPIGKLSDLHKITPLLGACAIAGGPLIFCLSLTRSPVLLAVIMLLVGLASAPVFLAVTLLVADKAGEQTGTAMGLISSIVFIAVGAGPLLTSLLATSQLRFGFLLPVAGSVLAIPLFFMITAGRRKRTSAELTAGPQAGPELTANRK